MPEVNLQPKTILAFNNRSDCGFFDSASVQVDADVLADLEFAFRVVLFAGHDGILHQAVRKTLQFRNMTRYSDWPKWLQLLVVAPHCVLLFVAVWLWWPKSDEDRRRFGFVFAYLLVFFLVMHFVFHF